MISVAFLSPRTDNQYLLDKFSLTSCYCSCVRGKIDKFSLTRSLVEKLETTAFAYGHVYADQENSTGKCLVRQCAPIVKSSLLFYFRISFI